MAADEKKQPSSRGQAWFCTTGLPSDIVVDVGDMTFHLHKFPLMSKSRRLHEMITEQETTIPATRLKEATDAGEAEAEEEDDGEIEEAEPCYLTLTDFPGGSEAFEMAAKFCYGVKMDLTAANVAPLRCASEVLEMTDEYCEGNLVSRTEKFFSHSVLKSIRSSIKALDSCKDLMPLAENLDIPQRCIESICASSADPKLFGWPVNDGEHDGSRGEFVSNLGLWNGIDTGGRRKNGSAVKAAPNVNFWIEDLSHLSFPLFKRLILAMRARDLSSEIVESCLMCYAKKHIPGVSRSTRKPSSSSSIASESDQKELLETIITNLPLEKSSRSTTSTRFLFGLLRTSNILNASEACKAALERKIGSQLDQATLDDLLIPSYSYLNETLYDVDCVERILGYFLDGLEEKNADEIEGQDERGSENASRYPSLTRVGKLIDGYLSEIAPDANLKPDKFYHLAMTLPEQARVFDDGLYRSVDVYLKAHPWIPESEREKICGVMDCQKLTLEACTHAAQNERLPLRAVVQVLFFEQLQLRHAIAGTLTAAETAAMAGTGRPSALDQPEEEENGAAPAEENTTTWRAAVRENQVLRLDMDSMRTRVYQLERECSTMKKVIEKIDKEGGPQGWRGSLTRRFGCKFKTQVCDSQESTAVEGRRGRHHHHQS